MHKIKAETALNASRSKVTFKCLGLTLDNRLLFKVQKIIGGASSAVANAVKYWKTLIVAFSNHILDLALFRIYVVCAINNHENQKKPVRVMQDMCPKGN